jgi:membrane protein DedA with SNARE-associated domain
MPWRTFMLWNAVAAVGWTVAAGLGGYLIGPAITGVLKSAGLGAAVAGVAGVVVILFVRRRRSQSR